MEEEVVVEAPYEQRSDSQLILSDPRNIAPVPYNLRGANRGMLILNENNRNHFGRRVYLDDSGAPKYMQSTIGYLFDNPDGNPTFPLDRKISNEELN